MIKTNLWRELSGWAEESQLRLRGLARALNLWLKSIEADSVRLKARWHWVNKLELKVIRALNLD
jgi:hypothetical protein